MLAKYIEKSTAAGTAGEKHLNQNGEKTMSPTFQRLGPVCRLPPERQKVWYNEKILQRKRCEY